MSSLTDSNARQNGSDGNEVGTCFITSESYPDSNFLISVVDLPTPSDGFNYSFEVSYSNGWLSYIYQADPNANSSELTTFMMPPYPCSQDEMNGGIFANVTVVDQAKTAPKTGQVSNIQFAGKFELPPEAAHLKIQNNDASLPGQSNWIVNLFIINSSTQEQSFGVVTCPINPYLDGYNGPYSEMLTIDLAASGSVSVTPNKPLPSETGQINGVAIGVAAAPLGVIYRNWQVWPGGAVQNSANTSGSYQGASLSSDNPTTTL